MELDVGRKVRVIKDIFFNHDYGIKFNREDIEEYMNKIVTIDKVIEKDGMKIYKIKEDINKMLWTRSMFQYVCNIFEATKNKSIIYFVNTLNNKKAKFDLKDNSCYKFYNNKYNKVKNLKSYFSGYELCNIYFKDDSYRKLIEIVNEEEDLCCNVGTLLDRLYKYSHLENYILLGIRFENSIENKTTDYNKYIIKYIRERNYKISRSFEMKYNKNKDLVLKIIRYINENYDDNMNNIIFSSMLNSYYDFSWDNFKELVLNYNYDYRKLLEYVVDYLPNREGFNFGNSNSDNIRILLDYANMQKLMSKNGKFDKYPKYLKTVHDITVSNFNTFKKEYNEKMFKDRIRLDYEFESKQYNYRIICPKTANEVKQEGVDMHHCVGSYIDKIINGKTYIVFMRRFNKPKESLVTVEIKNGAVCQAYRVHDSSITEEDKNFLKYYCKKKNLEYQWV